jgi:hypothetical protein
MCVRVRECMRACACELVYLRTLVCACVCVTKVPGLFFVGASTRPGNGVPLVMISADLVTKRILDAQQARGQALNIDAV